MAVRREKVELILEDHFTGPIVRAATAVEVLNKRLDSLSGEAVRSSKSTRDIEKNTDSLGKTAARTEKDIDRLSGRLRLMAEVSAVLGPSLVPIGTAGVAAVSGLAAEFGFAALGAGTAILAFQGVGDALKAVNKAALEPTEANLDAARLAMNGLSGEARSFVTELNHLMPTLLDLRDVAAAGFLPGLTEGIQSLETALPAVERIISSVSNELGQIAASTGASFASDRWAPFLDFLATEAPYALHNLALAIGNTTHALAELWMATTPLNDGFSEWLVKATGDLDKWAEGVSKTQGFQEFVQYIEDTGPQVAETLGAIANTFLQVAEAAAPLGGPILKGLEAVANIISTIADSDLGTPIFGALTALTLYNRTLQLTGTLTKTAFGKSLSQAGGFLGGSFKDATGIKTLASDISLLRRESAGLKIPTAGFIGPLTEAEAAAKRTRTTIGGLAKSGAVIGGLALVTSGLADEMGASNTATLAMAGSIAGPWGAAVGGGIGLLKDFGASANISADALQRYQALLLAKSGPTLEDQIKGVRAEQAALTKQLPGDVLGGNPFSGSQVAAKLKANKDLLADLTTEQKKAAISADYAASAEGRLSAAAQRQAAAVIAAGTAARQSGTQFLAFGDNLDDSKTSLNAWIKSQQEQVTALRNATANALTASDKGVAGGLIQKLMNEGPAGALRLQQLAKGTKEQIDAANRGFRQGLKALNGWEDAGKRVQNKLNEIADKKYRLKLTADTQPAWLAALALQYRISQLSAKISVGAVIGAVGVPATADGGSIPKDNLGYADRYLYMLAPGEEVISNRYGQADQFRADRDAGRIPGYADGGTTGGSKASSKRPKHRDVLTKAEYSDALSSLIDGLNSTLGLGPTGPGAEIRSAFSDFAKTIRDNGGKVGSRFHVLEEQLVRTAVALDRQKTKLDGLNTSLDDLKQSASSLASSVASGFTTDIFSSSYDPFAASDQAIRDAGGTPATHSQAAILGAGLQQVLQDAKNASQFASDIDRLKQNGFGGAGLEALANSNNLSMADALLGLSPQALQAANAAFARRSQTLNAAGNTVSNAVFGDGINRLETAIVATNQRIDSLTKIEKEGVSAIQGLPPRIGTSVTNSLNGVAHAASVKGGR